MPPQLKRPTGDNIDTQVAHFTQDRFKKVSAIYKRHAVVAYVNSKWRDGGIRGVAKGDGVYQPQENIVHDITVRNYGHQPATGVLVILNNGEDVHLPDLPGQSTVTVRGAAKSQVRADLGSEGRASLTLMKVFTSTDRRVEGRHFLQCVHRPGQRGR